MLEALEFILAKEKTKAVIYIDEFQEVAETQSGKAIEGAIRHFAQESEHIVFIFSGCNRKMLKKIFNDRTRPLYTLCDEIRLDRIDEQYYVKYLQKISKKTLNKSLSIETIQTTILHCTDRHPYYVFQRYKDVRFHLSNRTQTQIQLMLEIAKGNQENLTGKNNLLLFGMTSSTVVQALKILA